MLEMSILTQSIESSAPLFLSECTAAWSILPDRSRSWKTNWCRGSSGFVRQIPAMQCGSWSMNSGTSSLQKEWRQHSISARERDEPGIAGRLPKDCWRR